MCPTTTALPPTTSHLKNMNQPKPLTIRDIREASTNYLRACLKEDIDVTTHDMIDKELYVREERRSIT